MLAEGDALADYREAHPLSRVFPLLYDVLGRAAEECDSVLAVGDAHGQLLWVCGRAAVLKRAERIHFVEGAVWDEAHAGTNAPGTALRLDAAGADPRRPSTSPARCSPGPARPPRSTTRSTQADPRRRRRHRWRRRSASPQTLAMVRAAARMAEAELGRLVALAPPRAAVAAAARVAIEALGRPDCQLTARRAAGCASRPRHSEILVMLVEHARTG